MTYDGLKKIFEKYSKAEKEYKNEAEKYFPTVFPSIINIKNNSISKEQINKVVNLRKIKEQKETEWQEAMIEFYKNKNKSLFVF